MPIQFVLPFSKLGKTNVDIAGGKGASLGEMSQAGIPVPPGCVVLAGSFDQFVKETGIDKKIEIELKNVNPKNIMSVDAVSANLRKLIKNAKFPMDIGDEVVKEFLKLKSPFVAVRSSATAEDSSAASWAGELESYLFVTKQKLLEAVKTCWSSLFTPRAIFYRIEKKLHKQKVSVAVVIQKMVNSEIAGIAFTVHPVTKNRNHIVIEAGWGQGESVVSGRVTPDTYVYDKKTGGIVEVNIGSQRDMIIQKAGGGSKTVVVPSAKQEKQKLTGKQIIEIAKICERIEKHYKYPQVIEWALEKGRFYIVQSRPITTL
ncbi:MAG: PEP/pyruvate-binding domain-containing protein [Patescibacteria group bacterium]